MLTKSPPSAGFFVLTSGRRPLVAYGSGRSATKVQMFLASMMFICLREKLDERLLPASSRGRPVTDFYPREGISALYTLQGVY